VGEQHDAIKLFLAEGQKTIDICHGVRAHYQGDPQKKLTFCLRVAEIHVGRIWLSASASDIIETI
jgi:hypothetical protein